MFEFISGITTFIIIILLLYYDWMCVRRAWVSTNEMYIALVHYLRIAADNWLRITLSYTYLSSWAFHIIHFYPLIFISLTAQAPFAVSVLNVNFIPIRIFLLCRSTILPLNNWLLEIVLLLSMLWAVSYNFVGNTTLISIYLFCNLRGYHIHSYRSISVSFRSLWNTLECRGWLQWVEWYIRSLGRRIISPILISKWSERISVLIWMLSILIMYASGKNEFDRGRLLWTPIIGL